MDEKGLESKEALRRLHSELEATLARCHARRSHVAWMKEAWLPGSARSLFRLTSLVCAILLALALVAASPPALPALVSAALILALTTLSLVLSGWESYQRSVEVFCRAEHVARLVREAAAGPGWSAAQHPHLHTPVSSQASLVLQWTVRGGARVALPWPLLVAGDAVLLRPGQAAPARCRDADGGVLEAGEVHGGGGGRGRDPGPDTFTLLDTPYLAQLEAVLAGATDKPLSVLVKERHFLISSLLEYTCTPLVAVLVLAWNCVRHLYSWGWVAGQPMAQLFLTEPVTATLPLLPLMFPLWWVLVNTAALSNVVTIFRQAKVLAAVSADPFDDTVEPPDMEQAAAPVPLHRTWNTFWSCFLGRGEHLCRSLVINTSFIIKLFTNIFSRTENILHCLGSVTSFCCTDKKGILSWPNTSPEKLFFMKKVESGKEAAAEEQEGQEAPATEAALVPEILTISHDHNNPYQLQFDDPSWRRHLPSLKPLGVSVLLNTCNLETEEKYADFYHFLVTQSSCQGRRPELLPIPSRGCLCQLSQRLGLGGWHPPLVPEWRLVTQLQSYRPLASSDSAFTRNLSLARLKFPFPHQVSVVARESSGGRVSLLSQGTADIVLDSCQDAWTGHDLAPLSAAARKKCSEFYHRASLTAYCTTFAYKPLLPGAVCRGGEAGYIEIPSSLPISVQSKLRDLDNVSVSSLDGDLLHTQDSADVLTTLHSQSFLGMVQMQYQAMVDMVQFIDLLEKACIRFVHFSKENELRSKVFSEKMGLESGWNCHISLHSQADVEAAPGLMYGSRVLRSSNVDRSFGKNSSVPAKLNHDWRLCDIPQWTESSQPLLKGKLEEGAELSTAGSISSMLEYDMNNRAQLPAGIENIRPHLEQMDNVPLLVSLFTDCTPATTREMVRILQENCEVVAVLGSSANYHNMTIFLAADASIAVEPLYPQVCRKVDVMASCAGLAPTELARHMVSIGTSVSFKREETDVSVYRAIIRSRRHVLAIRHGLQLWTSCCLFLTSLVLASLLLLLPRFNRLKYFYCSVNIFTPLSQPAVPAADAGDHLRLHPAAGHCLLLLRSRQQHQQHLHGEEQKYLPQQKHALAVSLVLRNEILHGVYRCISVSSILTASSQISMSARHTMFRHHPREAEFRDGCQHDLPHLLPGLHLLLLRVPHRPPVEIQTEAQLAHRSSRPAHRCLAISVLPSEVSGGECGGVSPPLVLDHAGRLHSRPSPGQRAHQAT